MTAPARFRKADVRRLLEAAKESGFEELRLTVGLDGALELALGTTASRHEAVDLD